MRTLKAYFLAALPLLLLAVFGMQVAVAFPQHAFHGSSAHCGQPENESPAGSQADDSHCDFTLAFLGLDSHSVAPPPVFALHETAFAITAVYASFQYSHPFLSAQARGPPALS